MKRTIKLALSASLLLGATSAFATNGDLMIGQGAKSRSMGGVGIAKSFGAEGALANPAAISSVKDMEFTGAVTYFDPSVTFGSNAGSNMQQALGANGTALATIGGTNDTSLVVAGPTATIVPSDSGTAASVIPEMYYAARLSDSMVIGISVAGVAGMGTDYSDAATSGAFSMNTALSLLKVAIPFSYSTSGLTVGIAPVLQYGSLEMNHDTFSTPEANSATSTGYGAELGLTYDFKEAGVDGLTLGLVYKSKIAMEYKDVIGSSLVAFGADDASRLANAGASDGISSGDSLDQPAEFGFGLAYEMSGSTIAFDYKNIAWSDAAGYADFGWEDQNVMAVGYEYAGNGWALRAGYNYSQSPIVEQDGSKSTTQPGENYMGAVKNFFNLSGFPGIVESHMTLGAGYSFSDALSLDASFVYAPEVSVSYDTSGLTEGATYQFAGGNTNPTDPNNAVPGAVALGSAESSADVTHSQMGVTIAMTYAF